MVSMPNLSRSTVFIIVIWLVVIAGVPAFFFVSSHIGPAVNSLGANESERGVSREIHHEPITGKNNSVDPRGIHIQNLDNTNHTVSVTITNDTGRLWGQSYKLSSGSELEVLGLLAKKGVYTLEIGTETGEHTSKKITIDQDHGYMIVNINSNSINVTQTLDRVE